MCTAMCSVGVVWKCALQCVLSVWCGNVHCNVFCLCGQGVGGSQILVPASRSLSIGVKPISIQLGSCSFVDEDYPL
jgi:hypothetical protein